MNIKPYIYMLVAMTFYLLLGMIFSSCGSRAQASLSQAMSQVKSKAQDLLPSEDQSQAQADKASAKDSTFWDDYDFYNVALIHQPEVTEQKFANFCVALSKMPEPERSRQVDTLLTRSLRGSRDTFANFMTLAEKYLYDPNSPYRNGELYLPFLQWTIRCNQIEEVWKERPRYQLKLVLENRVGTQAHDFHYITNGNKGTLYGIKSEYTLIYFNNPECHDCGRVHGYLSTSKVFNKLLGSGRLKLLALYPDEDLGSWTRHKAEYPNTWIAARYAMKADREYYHLQAIPSLYLLDKNKKVLLKDATVEAVEEYLRKVESSRVVE